MDETEVRHYLERRLGRLHAKQRLGIERDHEAQIFGQGLNFFHIENFTLSHFLIEWALKLSGLYWRGKRNASRILVRENSIRSALIPSNFDGFSILQLSDLHADMSEMAMRVTEILIQDLKYDICVLTGDYRGKTSGPYEPSLKVMSRLTAQLSGPVYAVLGNHDTIKSVPGMEALGIQMLLNEHVVLEREGARIHLAGIDDAHFYRMDNIEKAAAQIPHDEFSILLSHTPEIYRQAAHADFNVLLSGHTHGGQICLPGQIPITLDSVLPRRMGSGRWQYADMIGYTSVGTGSSVVPVRFNCPPEVTVHKLQRIDD